MKKFLTLALAGVLALGISSVAFANICAFDAVPAATLLFPFVEYDYSGAGATTAFAITNVSSEAQVVHITVWTDYSVAILDFNVLLTGYDVQTFDIGLILRDGILPVTGDPVNSPWGPTPHSDGPISETNTLNGDWVDNLLDAPWGTWVCNEGDPADYAGGIDQPFLDLFETWLMKSQGGATRAYSDQCSRLSPWAGAPGTDVSGTWWQDDAFNAARATWMYITADVVLECNLSFPDESGYFADTLRSDDNVLMGDVFQLNGATGFSSADHAVHIEADTDLAAVATEGNPGYPASFYARYANADGENDYREPLGTAWAMRYLNGADYATHIRAWKGGIAADVAWNPEAPIVADLHLNEKSENVSSMTASNCLAYTYYAWDEYEDVTSVTDNPWSQPGGGRIVANLLPLETQEVDINEFTLPGDFGWILFVWPHSNYYDDLGAFAGTDPDMYQTWMGVRYTAFGAFSEGLSGLLMANYNCFCDQILPNLGVNYEYTGNGYTDATGYTTTLCPVPQ